MELYNNTFDLILIIAGGYIFFYTYQMKANDIIKPGVIIPRTVSENRLKDREGFKKYAFICHLIQSIFLAALGLGGAVLTSLGMGEFHVIIYAVALIILLVGNFFIERGKRKFY